MSFLGGGGGGTDTVRTSDRNRSSISSDLGKRLSSGLFTRGQQVDPRQRAAAEAVGQAGEAGGLRGGALDAIAAGIQGTSPEGFRGEVEAASAGALRDLRRSILPSINSEFAAAGGRGGSGGRQAAIQDAAGAVASRIGEASSGLINADRNRRLAAAGQAGTVAQQDAQRALQELNARQSIDPFNRLSQVAGLIPGLRDTNVSSGTQQTPRQGGGIGGALGTIAGGALGSFLGPIGSGAGASLAERFFGGGGGGAGGGAPTKGGILAGGL